MSAASRIFATTVAIAGLAALVAFASVWLARPALGGAPIVVTNTNDAGAGSLRQAILDANAAAGLDTISFDPSAFPPGSPATISPATELPDMSDADGTIVDGTGAGVIIDGSGFVGTESGLTFDSATTLTNASVVNLVVQNFPRHGINMQGNGGNLVDASVVDVTATGNASIGVNLNSTSETIGASLSGVTANQNTSTGVSVNGDLGLQDLTVSGSTANGNGTRGFIFSGGGGSNTGASISDSIADDNVAEDGVVFDSFGDVTNAQVSGVTASGNGRRGFSLHSANDIDGATISGSTADGNGGRGIHLNAGQHLTDVSISDSTSSNSTTERGIYLNAGDNNTGATLSDNIVTGNAERGIYLNAGESLTDATITGNDSTGNGDHGIYMNAGGIDTRHVLTGNDFSDNAGDGVHMNAGNFLTEVTVTGNLIAENEDSGIYNNAGEPAGNVRDLTGNIICGNVVTGIDLPDDITVPATGIWWGDPSGPTHPNNPGGSGDGVSDSASGGAGTVTYDPWVDTINASADPATEGSPSTVAFQFASADGTAFLGQGAGPFTVTTDNGSLSPSAAFVNAADGTVEVQLTPETDGQATVSIVGPCGLDETLGGNSITLDVAAQPVEPAATPAPTSTATPAELPETGGPRAGGQGFPWLGVAALVGAVAALTGGALALRRAHG